jgi:FixJ family two-component response regulator
MPLIFITAHEDPRIRKTALEAGAMAFFHKPVDDQMLFEAIDLALSRIA